MPAATQFSLPIKLLLLGLPTSVTKADLKLLAEALDKRLDERESAPAQEAEHATVARPHATS